MSGIPVLAKYGFWRAVCTTAVEGGVRGASDLVLHRIALRKKHRQTRLLFLPSTVTLPLSGQSWPVFFRA